MQKLENIYRNSIRYLSEPRFLRMALLVFGFLFVLYNVALFIRFLWKRFKKSVPKEEAVNLSSPAIRLKNFSKNIVIGFLEASIVSNLIFFLGVGTTFAAITVPTPKVIFPTEPALGITEITDEKPITIKFDRPIDTKILKYQVTPELDGSWDFTSSSNIVSDSLKFTPKETPKAEERYTVSLTNIKSILGSKKENYLFSFQTAPAPKIISVAPGSGDIGILPNQEITVVTDYPHESSAEFGFETTPPLDLAIRKDELRYIVKPKDGFRKGTDYNLKISRTLVSQNYKTGEKKALSEKEEIWNGGFRTIDAPGVKSYSPTGAGVLADTSIKIEFRQDMEPSSTQAGFSINPKAEGSFSWEGTRVLNFKPKEDLAKNTKYTISVSKQAKAADSSPFEEEFVFNFTTIGYVTASLSPAGSGVSNGGGRITVSFNQAVDHASAQSKFSISPNIAGSFSWSGNAMYFNYSGLSYSTTYSANIASGVKSVYGIDSVQAFGTSFMTKAQSVTLNVPSYRQSHMYSCMASAARQALAYRGVYVSEDTLLSQMGYDYTPFSGTWGDPNAIWGDPDNGVTGNINGASGGVSWGYGAHAGPTARAISNYRGAEVRSGWTVQGIAQEIASGNPVIVYWVNGVWPSYVVNWKTPSGKVIRGVNGMHVQVVKGFTGTVDNPTSFIVNDSGYGYPSRTFDVGTFKSKWSWYGNTGIIVR